MVDPFVNQAVMTLVGLIVGGLFGYVVSQAKKRTAVERAQIEILKATARKDIFDYYQHHVVEGAHLTIARYDEIIREYEAYKVLGGNGTAEAYMEKIREINPYMVID